MNKVVVVALLVAGCAGGDGEATRRFMSVGTAGTGGIYYPLGGALASQLSIVDSGRQYTAEVTGGSVENVNRIAAGEMDLAFCLGNTVYEAYTGGLDYPQPVSELRIVAPLYPNVTHVVVSSAFTGRSLADVRGRRVSVGPPGSGTEQIARQLLEAYDLDYDDIDPRYLSFRESSDALRDGAIDAAIISVGYPASAVLEATTHAARLLPIDATHRRALAERYSYYTDGRIPAGAYPGLRADIPTVAVMNWIVAREDLEAAVVRYLLDIFRDRRQSLVRVHDIARQIELDALRDAPIPLHPETARWLDAEGADGVQRPDGNGEGR